VTFLYSGGENPDVAAALKNKADGKDYLPSAKGKGKEKVLHVFSIYIYGSYGCAVPSFPILFIATPKFL
jgi:hypothetical protein